MLSVSFFFFHDGWVDIWHFPYAFSLANDYRKGVLEGRSIEEEQSYPHTHTHSLTSTSSLYTWTRDRLSLTATLTFIFLSPDWKGNTRRHIIRRQMGYQVWNPDIHSWWQHTTPSTILSTVSHLAFVRIAPYQRADIHALLLNEAWKGNVDKCQWFLNNTMVTSINELTKVFHLNLQMYISSSFIMWHAYIFVYTACWQNLSIHTHGQYSSICERVRRRCCCCCLSRPPHPATATTTPTTS